MGTHRDVSGSSITRARETPESSLEKTYILHAEFDPFSIHNSKNTVGLGLEGSRAEKPATRRKLVHRRDPPKDRSPQISFDDLGQHTMRNQGSRVRGDDQVREVRVGSPVADQLDEGIRDTGVECEGCSTATKGVGRDL